MVNLAYICFSNSNNRIINVKQEGGTNLFEKKTIIKSSFKSPPESYWLSSTKKHGYPALEGNDETDVVIIGGGIVGITTAYLLKDTGMKIAIVEKDRIMHGTTGYTTAKITSQHQLVYDFLINKVGREKAQQYADAHQAAIEMIASIIEENSIACDFSRQPAYVFTQYDSFIKNIDNEVIAAESLGLPATYVTSLDLPFDISCAVRFSDQAQFHPLKYLYALVSQLQRENCTIFENTRALKIEDEPQYTVVTDKGNIKAETVVVASHFPFHDKEGLYFARLYQSRSYIIAFRAQEKLPEGMFISAELPVRSLRTVPAEGGDMILLAGEGHRTGTGDNTLLHYENLKNMAGEMLKAETTNYHWSAQDCMTLDSIPYIGRLTPGQRNLYVATGFKKWGMTGGTAAAMIITDMIKEKENPWAPVFDPARLNVTASAANFIKNAAKLTQELVGGKLEIVEESLEGIKNGESRIVRKDGKRIGVYKDDEGNLHTVDTTCTHMRCELSWNEAEKTWDCPCHGSRFTYDGKVVEGPAVKDLEQTGIE
jgi:glycine/D-amino acid oxidase-like deaminating enzyme/nitrite reductase/ring-hydroxylating ferredoxin subunit